MLFIRCQVVVKRDPSCQAESDGADRARLAFGLDPVEGVEGCFGIGERGTEQHPKPAPAFECPPDGFVIVELLGEVLWVRINHGSIHFTQIPHNGQRVFDSHPAGKGDQKLESGRGRKF